jgi:hypothetical protein
MFIAQQIENCPGYVMLARQLRRTVVKNPRITSWVSKHFSPSASALSKPNATRQAPLEAERRQERTL